MPACRMRALNLRTVLGALVAAGAASAGWAGGLEVSVQDARGEPLEGIAVYARPAAPSSAELAAENPGERPAAVMDQQGQAFVPHILIVEAGTSVLFPNSDPVSHHVYSFSETKQFELGLYKGNVHPPLVFDMPGVVVLGCNIHDGMLGYILVVDTPHFALTDERGRVMLSDLPPGEYSVAAWTPRTRPSGLPAATRVQLAPEAAQAVTLKFEGKLAPTHRDAGATLSWERY